MEHVHNGHDSLKSKIAIIAATTILLSGAALIEHYCSLPLWQLLLIYLVPYLLVGHDTLKEAAEGIVAGDVFNEDFLMTIATIGALCIGFMPGADTEFAEAVFVMLFFQIGELFEEYAEGRSRDSISHLMEIRPDTAHVERNGDEMTVAPEEVAVGETIIVKPGEKVPLDGIVVSGTSSLNTVALTGESMPREIGKGDDISSGCINLSGLLRVKTTKTFGESTVAKIIDLVENANESKSRSESFITKFARVYTPVVVIAALILAFLPPLLSSAAFIDSFTTWLHRALIFLVVSCPCALVISVPLTFFGGLGGASRKGILIKGSNYIDTLSRLGTVVFDKTGTLTRGEFAVEAVHPSDYNEKELLHLAAHVEHFSTHPIGAALRNAFPKEASDGCAVTDVEEIAGRGVKATVDGHTVCVGNSKMMADINMEWHDCHLPLHCTITIYGDFQFDGIWSYIFRVLVEIIKSLYQQISLAIALLKSFSFQLLLNDSVDILLQFAVVFIDRSKSKGLELGKVDSVVCDSYLKWASKFTDRCRLQTIHIKCHGQLSLGNGVGRFALFEYRHLTFRSSG